MPGCSTREVGHLPASQQSALMDKKPGSTQHVAFSPQIVAHALAHYEMNDAGNFKYTEAVYRKLGYTITGDKVSRPTPNWKKLWE